MDLKKLVEATYVDDSKLKPVYDFSSKKIVTYVGNYPKEHQPLIDKVAKVAKAEPIFIRVDPRRIQVAFLGDLSGLNDEFAKIPNYLKDSAKLGVIEPQPDKPHTAKQHTVVFYKF